MPHAKNHPSFRRCSLPSLRPQEQYDTGKQDPQNAPSTRAAMPAGCDGEHPLPQAMTANRTGSMNAKLPPAAEIPRGVPRPKRPAAGGNQIQNRIQTINQKGRHNSMPKEDRSGIHDRGNKDSDSVVSLPAAQGRERGKGENRKT